MPPAVERLLRRQMLADFYNTSVRYKSQVRWTRGAQYEYSYWNYYGPNKR